MSLLGLPLLLGTSLFFGVDLACRKLWSLWLRMSQRCSDANDAELCSRLACESVAWLHALVATVLSIVFFNQHGHGLDGWHSISTPLLGAGSTAGSCWYPAQDDVVMKAVLLWSLSFAAWDLVECCRNIKQHGAVMVLHAIIMGSSIAFVVSHNYELHAMVSQIVAEASTLFLKPRALLLLLHGKRAKEQTAFRTATGFFGCTFLVVRIGYLGARNAVHLMLVYQRVQAGLYPRCWGDAATGLYIDFSLIVLNSALNLFWAGLIVRGACRGSHTNRPKTA